MTEKFIIALIGAPFGLKGQVKVRPLSGDIENLLKLQSVAVRHHSQEGPGTTERILQIEESFPQPPAVLMKFAGFDTPEAAKALQGAELLADREHASPLQPGEFYIEDLRGLAVTAAPGEAAAPEGKIIGHITDIIEGGGGELAEIRLLAENADEGVVADGELKLVPFRREFFAEISPEKGRVVLKNLWILT
ncbi:ribosome maturation factor RimM [Spirochaetia bacterium]|nr:ribosome maturation factor RimM [Spirochaetia bacterium]